MHDIFLRAKPLAGNHKDIKSENVALLRYVRPSIKGSMSESSTSSSLRFGTPIIGSFSVVTNIGNHAEGALRWVTDAETIDRVEVVIQGTVNGSLYIIGKDIYRSVVMQDLRIIFNDNAEGPPLLVFMSFTSKYFQLATVNFKHDTSVDSRETVLIKHHRRKVKT